MPEFTVPLNPAPMPAAERGDVQPPMSKLVRSCEVFAHQSTSGPDCLNVEIDAPAGVTVRVHVNDCLMGEATVDR